MTLIIKNVKEEHLPAFREFSAKMNASLSAKQDDEVCDYGYSHEPNEETALDLKNAITLTQYKSHEQLVKDLQAEIKAEK